MYTADFKEKIKAIRKELNMTQEDFAKFVGVTRTTITNYEAGNTKPTYQALEEIIKKIQSKIKNFNVNYFLDNNAEINEDYEKLYKLTGLSSNAIEKLKRFKNKSRGLLDEEKFMYSFECKMVSALIEDDNFYSVIYNIIEAAKNDNSEFAKWKVECAIKELAAVLTEKFYAVFHK